MAILRKSFRSIITTFFLSLHTKTPTLEVEVGIIGMLSYQREGILNRGQSIPHGFCQVMDPHAREEAVYTQHPFGNLFRHYQQVDPVDR